MIATAVPYLLLGAPRTVEFTLTVLDNQSHWTQIHRRVVEGVARLSADGSLATRFRDFYYRFYFLPEAPVEFETILIRQERQFYVDHDKRTARESPCHCSWAREAQRKPDPLCGRIAAEFDAVEFVGRGTVASIPVVRYQGSDDGEQIAIELAPGRDCEVMSYWRGLSLLGFACYGRQYRVTRLTSGEPAASAFRPPASYRILSSP